MTLELARHHPVLGRFGRWEGEIEPGYFANFLGVKTRTDYVSAGEAPVSDRAIAKPALPDFNEEYCEWIDLLEAVEEAPGEFAMIELGAGYGRWTANAAAALRTRNRLSPRFVAVEAEPTHFRWLREHLACNGVDLSRCTLCEAAVAARDGELWFHVGNPAQWYGQAIARRNWREKLLRLFGRRPPPSGGQDIKKVRALSLASLLDPLRRVDLIDMDVQGAELEVLESAAPHLHKVRRLHIGTHGTEIEAGLRALFQRLGWRNRNDYPCGRESETDYGRITFQDGVQTWINPRSG